MIEFADGDVNGTLLYCRQTNRIIRKQSKQLTNIIEAATDTINQLRDCAPELTPDQVEEYLTARVEGRTDELPERWLANQEEREYNG